MFKEQLAEIRKTRKTLLHRGKTLVRFVEDETLDNRTLLGMIEHRNPYTDMRALLFERHRLSEKENLVFNAQFSAFLRGLVEHMNDQSVDVLLEFLVRVYHIDTYNTHELLFLILPFKRYAAQIKILSGGVSSLLAGMKEYSIRTISKATLEDPRLMRSFVDYFRHYGMLHGFLDRVLDEAARILKGSNYDWLSEMHQIFVHLISHNHQARALDIYHSLRGYLDSDEFVELLLPYYTEDAIRQIVPRIECLPIYEEALRSGSGRRFLLDDQQLQKYLQFCEARNAAPREFTDDEYRLLRCVHLNRAIVGEPVDPANVVEMYAASASRIGMTKILALHANATVLLGHMDDEDKAYFVNNSDSLHTELLTDRNHGLLVRNMKSSVFRPNYREILTVCLEFVSFDASLFDTFIMVHAASETGKRNIIRLAAHHNRCLVEELLPHSVDSVFLSYLLRAQYGYGVSTIMQLVENAKSLRQPGLISDACVLLSNCTSAELVCDFCAWVIANGYSGAASHFIERNADLLSSALLTTFVQKILSGHVVQILLARQAGLVEMAYNDGRHDILLQIVKASSVAAILIAHPRVFDFLAANYEFLPDQQAIAAFAIENILLEGALQCALRGYSHLIVLRTHRLWPAVKAIIMGKTPSRDEVEQFTEHILKNIGQFENDADLFAWQFSNGMRMSAEQLEGAAGEQSAQAADLINEAVKARAAEVLPVIPMVAPILIKHRKESIRLLFEEFGDLLYAYAGSILAHYPEQLAVLVHLDPRFSLGEIISYLEGSMPSVSDGRREGLIRVTRDILSKGKCKSSAVLRRTALFLRLEAALENIPEDIYKSFVLFYIRSCGKLSDAAVEELLLELSIKQPTLFLALAAEHMGSSSDIFQAAYMHAAESILSGDGLLMGFAADFINHCPERAACGGLPLCKKVFELADGNSAALLAALCRADSSLVSEVNSHIGSAIAGGRGVAHGLTTLAFLFKRVPAFKAHKASVLPLSAILSENTDESIAESARILHESLQFLH